MVGMTGVDVDFQGLHAFPADRTKLLEVVHRMRVRVEEGLTPFLYGLVANRALEGF